MAREVVKSMLTDAGIDLPEKSEMINSGMKKKMPRATRVQARRMRNAVRNALELEFFLLSASEEMGNIALLIG